MRIDLPKKLKKGETFKFKIDWNYNIPDKRMKQGGRGGYEFFPEDGNHLFTITQWYPRLCVYSGQSRLAKSPIYRSWRIHPYFWKLQSKYECSC